MSQSHARVVVHIVFSTKHRTPWLTDRGICEELYKYVAQVLITLDCPAIIVNGVAEHMHILCNLSRRIAIMDLIEELKKSTSKWIKAKSNDLAKFYWQGGYGIFSVSESNVPEVRKYIEKQEEHHRVMTYQDEYRILCKKHGVEIDERYVWD